MRGNAQSQSQSNGALGFCTTGTGCSTVSIPRMPVFFSFSACTARLTFRKCFKVLDQYPSLLSLHTFCAISTYIFGSNPSSHEGIPGIWAVHCTFQCCAVLCNTCTHHARRLVVTNSLQYTVYPFHAASFFTPSVQLGNPPEPGRRFLDDTSQACEAQCSQFQLSACPCCLSTPQPLRAGLLQTMRIQLFEARPSLSLGGSSLAVLLYASGSDCTHGGLYVAGLD